MVAPNSTILGAMIAGYEAAGVGIKYDGPDCFVTSITVLALLRLKTFIRRSSFRERMTLRAFDTLRFNRFRFGRCWLPSGSTRNVMLGMVAPPVKSTCRANTSPLRHSSLTDTVT